MSEVQSTMQLVEEIDLSKFERLREYINTAPVDIPLITGEIKMATFDTVDYVFQTCWGKRDIAEGDIVRLGHRFWEEKVFGEILEVMYELHDWIESFRKKYGVFLVEYTICDGMIFDQWSQRAMIDVIVGERYSPLDALLAVAQKKKELVVNSHISGIEGVPSVIIRNVKEVFGCLSPMYARLENPVTFLEFICIHLDAMASLTSVACHINIESNARGLWEKYGELFIHHAEVLKALFIYSGIPIDGEFTTADEIIAALVAYYQKRLERGVIAE